MTFHEEDEPCWERGWSLLDDRCRVPKILPHVVLLYDVDYGGFRWWRERLATRAR